MAALTSSGVTINSRYNLPAATEGKRQIVDATLVLSSQGGASNNIPVSLLGLASIDGALSVVDSSDNIYLGAPSYDRTKLTISSTSATTGAPTDISATVRVVVTGIPTLFAF